MTNKTKTPPSAKLRFLQSWVPGLPQAVAHAVAANSTWLELREVVDSARAELGLPSILDTIKV